MNSRFRWSFIIALFLSALPSWAFAASSQKGIEPFLKTLIQAGNEAHRKKDLAPLQAVVGTRLDQWFYPSACLVFQQSFTKENLKGWITSTGAQDPVQLLTIAFSNLKDMPLVTLKNASFDPYRPDSCGDDEAPKKKEWYGKWILYPGDYLGLTKQKGPCDLGKSPPVSIEKTLMYFDAFENFYFGLNRVNGKWMVIAVAVGSDCDA